MIISFCLVRICCCCWCIEKEPSSGLMRLFLRLNQNGGSSQGQLQMEMESNPLSQVNWTESFLAYSRYSKWQGRGGVQMLFLIGWKKNLFGNSTRIYRAEMVLVIVSWPYLGCGRYYSFKHLIGCLSYCVSRPHGGYSQNMVTSENNSKEVTLINLLYALVKKKRKKKQLSL